MPYLHKEFMASAPSAPSGKYPAIFMQGRRLCSSSSSFTVSRILCCHCHKNFRLFFSRFHWHGHCLSLFYCSLIIKCQSSLAEEPTQPIPAAVITTLSLLSISEMFSIWSRYRRMAFSYSPDRSLTPTTLLFISCKKYHSYNIIIE